METFGEKISAEACSGTGKEIAGLLRKMIMNMSQIACERILACQTGGR